MQNAADPLILMGWGGFTVTASEADEVPQVLVTVTVYVPAVVTVMAAVVEPLLHRKVVPPAAVRVTESPRQKVVDPLAVMAEMGNVSSVTVMDADEFPQELLPLTV